MFVYSSAWVVWISDIVRILCEIMWLKLGDVMFACYKQHDTSTIWPSTI